ncbi:MAG: hypothetical protein WC868_11355 [Bacteroidales bacterium]
MKKAIIILVILLIVNNPIHAQDSLKIKSTTNHLSVHGYLGYRYVDQEIPMSTAIGLGASYQMKKHFFTFRFITRVSTIYRTKNFMRVNKTLAPDETIWELGILYRFFNNTKNNFSLHGGFSLVKGFNHGELVYNPKTYKITYGDSIPFTDAGISLEARYLLGGKKAGKIFISSVANINSVKSYAGIMLLFQLTFPNHEK